MNQKKDMWIEVPGFLSLISLFLGIWLTEYRWRFIFSSLLLLIIAIVNTQTKKYLSKK